MTMWHGWRGWALVLCLFAAWTVVANAGEVSLVDDAQPSKVAAQHAAKKAAHAKATKKVHELSTNAGVKVRDPTPRDAADAAYAKYELHGRMQKRKHQVPPAVTKEQAYEVMHKSKRSEKKRNKALHKHAEEEFLGSGASTSGRRRRRWSARTSYSSRRRRSSYSSYSSRRRGSRYSSWQSRRRYSTASYSSRRRSSSSSRRRYSSRKQEATKEKAAPTSASVSTAAEDAAAARKKTATNDLAVKKKAAEAADKRKAAEAKKGVEKVEADKRKATKEIEDKNAEKKAKEENSSKMAIAAAHKKATMKAAKLREQAKEVAKKKQAAEATAKKKTAEANAKKKATEAATKEKTVEVAAKRKAAEAVVKKKHAAASKKAAEESGNKNAQKKSAEEAKKKASAAMAAAAEKKTMPASEGAVSKETSNAGTKRSVVKVAEADVASALLKAKKSLFERVSTTACGTATFRTVKRKQTLKCIDKRYKDVTDLVNYPGGRAFRETLTGGTAVNVEVIECVCPKCSPQFMANFTSTIHHLPKDGREITRIIGKVMQAYQAFQAERMKAWRWASRHSSTLAPSLKLTELRSSSSLRRRSSRYRRRSNRYQDLLRRRRRTPKPTPTPRPTPTPTPTRASTAITPSKWPTPEHHVGGLDGEWPDCHRFTANGLNCYSLLKHSNQVACMNKEIARTEGTKGKRRLVQLVQRYARDLIEPAIQRQFRCQTSKCGPTLQIEYNVKKNSYCETPENGNDRRDASGNYIAPIQPIAFSLVGCPRQLVCAHYKFTRARVLPKRADTTVIAKGHLALVGFSAHGKRMLEGGFLKNKKVWCGDALRTKPTDSDMWFKKVVDRALRLAVGRYRFEVAQTLVLPGYTLEKGAGWFANGQKEACQKAAWKKSDEAYKKAAQQHSNTMKSRMSSSAQCHKKNEDEAFKLSMANSAEQSRERYAKKAIYERRSGFDNPDETLKRHKVLVDHVNRLKDICRSGMSNTLFNSGGGCNYVNEKSRDCTSHKRLMKCTFLFGNRHLEGKDFRTCKFGRERPTHMPPGCCRCRERMEDAAQARAEKSHKVEAIRKERAARKKIGEIKVELGDEIDAFWRARLDRAAAVAKKRRELERQEDELKKHCLSESPFSPYAPWWNSKSSKLEVPACEWVFKQASQCRKPTREAPYGRRLDCGLSTPLCEVNAIKKIIEFAENKSCKCDQEHDDNFAEGEPIKEMDKKETSEKRMKGMRKESSEKQKRRNSQPYSTVTWGESRYCCNACTKSWAPALSGSCIPRTAANTPAKKNGEGN